MLLFKKKSVDIFVLHFVQYTISYHKIEYNLSVEYTKHIV